MMAGLEIGSNFIELEMEGERVEIVEIKLTEGPRQIVKRTLAIYEVPGSVVDNILKDYEY